MVQLVQNKYNIPILSKGMELLELISENPQGMTLAELITVLDYPKTSIYRLVCSFEEMGFLHKDMHSGRFSLTRKIFGLALSTLGNSSILEHSYEPMRRLRDTIKETVVLGTLMGDKIVILEQVLGSHHFSFMLKPGMGICLHASAPGKAIMAYLDQQEQEKLLSTIDYTIYNERTIKNSDQMRVELQLVKNRGYSFDLGEDLVGVCCIGAPIFNQFGKVTASVWITGPEGRLPNNTLTEYATKVVACADEISNKLGYNN